MKKITFKELLDESTELGKARRKQLATNFEEMLRKARTADLSWVEQDTLEKESKVTPGNVFDIDAQRTLRRVSLKPVVAGHFNGKDT